MRVLNKKTSAVGPEDVYIGRPGKWGNPFVIGKDGSRADVVAKYEKHLRQTPDLLMSLAEIQGKNLVCFCAPLPCHGDVLKRFCENATRLNEAARDAP